MPWPAEAVGLTREQMAAALQVSVRTVGNMMKRGQLSYFKIGKVVRFRLEDALKRMDETVLVEGPTCVGVTTDQHGPTRTITDPLRGGHH